MLCVFALLGDVRLTHGDDHMNLADLKSYLVTDERPTERTNSETQQENDNVAVVLFHHGQIL